uniref:Uncharacterized protein n=1 Tax=Octactis speculum TaxID=3111310 RepID=A0A7S2GCR3_9STRA|mmetsp:Transcript_43299/g.59182  ORF Transcript_43299/g.59182 Transcript_43299/m.59182 type:complete len:306 (+) Transcript_43299:56-973(+)
MAGMVSFNPITRMGVVLLANCDASTDGGGSTLHQSEKGAVEALRSIREYLLDAFEDGLTPDPSNPPPPELDIVEPAVEYVRGNETTPGMVFKTYNIQDSSVDFMVTYDHFDQDRGHHIEVTRGSSTSFFYPVGWPKSGTMANGSLPTTFNRDGVNATGDGTEGVVRGTVTGLFPRTTYKLQARVVDLEKKALVSDEHTVTTLKKDGDPGPLFVSIMGLSCSGDGIFYRIQYQSVSVQHGMSLRLAVMTSPSSAPVRASSFQLRTATAVVTGTVQGLSRGVEYRFSAKIVDKFQGPWVSSNFTISC